MTFNLMKIMSGIDAQAHREKSNCRAEGENQIHYALSGLRQFPQSLTQGVALGYLMLPRCGK